MIRKIDRPLSSGTPEVSTSQTTSASADVALQRPGPAALAQAISALDAPRPVVVSEHREQVNGIAMYWVEAGEKKAGNTVVMLHGIPQHGYVYRKVLPDLVRRGFHVVVPDLRGFNNTEKPGALTDAHEYTLDKYAADIDALIARVSANGKALVVGHDFGGPVSYTIAAKYPDRVSGLMVVNGPHPSIWREELITKATRKQFEGAWYALVFARMPRLTDFIMRKIIGPERQINQAMRTDKRLAAKSGISEADVREYARPYDQNPEAARRMMLPYQALTLDGGAFGNTNYPFLRAALRSYTTHLLHLNGYDPFPHERGVEQKAFDFPPITVPTRVVFGADDGFITTANADSARLRPFVKGPLATHIVPGASHWLLEEEPKLVADHLEKLAASLPDRRHAST